MAQANTLGTKGILSGAFMLAGGCAVALGAVHGIDSLMLGASTIPANAMSELTAGAASLALGWGIGKTIDYANGKSAPAPAK